TAVEWLIEPLVRVERDRVGARHPGELRGLCESRGGAVGAVDVEPKVVRTSDVCECGQRINRAAHDGPGGTDQRDSAPPGPAIARDRALERIEIDAHVFVDGNEAQVRASKAEHRDGPRDRHMYL